MTLKRKHTISLILNIAMVVLVAYAISWFFTPEGLAEGVGNMQAGGVFCLQFFTIDSNILTAIACAVLIPFNIRAIRSGQGQSSQAIRSGQAECPDTNSHSPAEIPAWAMIFKFIGTVSVALTFLVVVAFLGPNLGYAKAFENSCLELHLICPLIAMISFVFFDHGYTLPKRQVLWGLIPLLPYGSLYATKVLILKTWDDFYCFNMGGYWYISAVVITVVTYLIGRLLAAAHNKYE